MELSKVLGGVNALLGIKGTAKEKKPSVVKSMMNRPEDFMLEAYFEGEEIVVRIKKRAKGVEGD